jgi:hypothetical protein
MHRLPAEPEMRALAKAYPQAERTTVTRRVREKAHATLCRGTVPPQVTRLSPQVDLRV